MPLQFTKMQGLGNDFVMINGISQTFNLTTKDIKQLSHRQFGIGFDQLLVVESTEQKNTDFKYRIFNADGGEVEQCGNGARCFALFVRAQGLTEKNQISVDTLGGRLILQVKDNNQVVVDMGPPELTPKKLPFLAEQQSNSYDLIVDNKKITLGAVSMGNPHAVMVVENIDSAPVHELGAKIEQHPDFPERANVGFMQIVNRNNIRLRVYERGASETLACGTGACAAVVVGITQQLLNREVNVQLPGGTLLIQWAGENQSVFMTGPATTVFEGIVNL